MSRPKRVWILYVPGAGACLSRTHLRIARACVRSLTRGGGLTRFGFCTRADRPQGPSPSRSLRFLLNTSEDLSDDSPDFGKPTVRSSKIGVRARARRRLRFASAPRTRSPSRPSSVYTRAQWWTYWTMCEPTAAPRGAAIQPGRSKITYSMATANRSLPRYKPEPRVHRTIPGMPSPSSSKTMAALVPKRRTSEKFLVGKCAAGVPLESLCPDCAPLAAAPPLKVVPSGTGASIQARVP